MDCIFCKIIIGKAEAVFLHEDDLVVAFLDIMPVNEGHALVVPREHHERVETLDEATYLHLFKIGRDLMRQIQTAFADVTAFNFIIANGKDAGQEVPHVHLHIIPRKLGDGFGYKFGPNYGKIVSIDERKATAKKILDR